MSTSDERARLELLRAIGALAPESAAPIDERALATIVANMPAYLVLIDPSGRFLWSNKHPEAIGKSMFDFIPEGDQADARAALERIQRTRRPERFTGFGPGIHGPRSRYENWIAPIVDGGRVIAIAKISRDVSDEWEVYQTLRDREQRLSLALRAAGMGTWRFDFATRTVELDEHARAIYGITVARLDSRTFTTTHIHADDRAEADRRALESATTRRPYVSQNRIIRTDGEVRWVEVTGTPILDESGALAALMGTITDITERRQLEERARQAQRLDAIGSLTAGIAHNFNNLLAAIMPALAMIERDVHPRSLSLVRDALRATERGADLVRQLMTFAGAKRDQVGTVEDPGALVERTVALCRSTFDRHIELRVELEPALPRIRVDVGQIEQALLNLMLNARDALIEAGSAQPMIRVSVARARDSAATMPAMIEIVVDDNGPGVAEALRERIFDPFFTTKPPGKGTGLGLATAYAIAREHGGKLTCDSEVGRGARFTLLLPAVDAPPVAPEAIATPATRARGTVLVVDDEQFVREAVARVLAEAGFTVRTAETGEHALRVLAAEPAVDAVLLDLNMPGPSWRTIVLAIRANHPQTRVVAFTGGLTARDAIVDGWLAKPAQPEEIIAAIERAVAPRT